MIFRYAIILVTILFSQGVNAQIVIPIVKNPDIFEQQWIINDVLDSIINKVNLPGGGIICVTDKFVSIDTITTNKIKQVGVDSVTVGNFLKKNQKKISSKEFWGVATADGGDSRLYQDKLYIVWETPSPYIYKLNDHWKADFYFSETLLSPIELMNTRNIDNAKLSDASKEILYKFLEDNNNAVAMRKEANKEMIINTSANVLSVLFEIMVFNASITRDHPPAHSHPDRPKPQTGRRGR